MSAKCRACFMERVSLLWCFAHKPLLSLPIIFPLSEVNLPNTSTSKNCGSFFSLQKRQFLGVTILLLDLNCLFIAWIKMECHLLLPAPRLLEEQISFHLLLFSFLNHQIWVLLSFVLVLVELLQMRLY